jgi:hypothetical protein
VSVKKVIGLRHFLRAEIASFLLSIEVHEEKTTPMDSRANEVI